MGRLITYFRQIRSDRFPGINDDGSIRQGVGYALKVGVGQRGLQGGGPWFPWVNNDSSIWEGVCSSSQGWVIESLKSRLTAGFS